jgi:hypothetical protein
MFLEEMKNIAVYICFLHPNNTDPIVNQLTGLIGGWTHGSGLGTCHVEASMPHQGAFLNTSIYNGEKISINYVKTFSNPGYDVHTVMVSDKQLDAMKRMVFALHTRGDSFDAVGMYLACLPIAIPRFNNVNTTFCSKYITEILQAAGVEEVKDLNPGITTPSRLLKKIRPVTRNVLGTVPTKLHVFEKKSVFKYHSVATPMF